MKKSFTPYLLIGTLVLGVAFFMISAVDPDPFLDKLNKALTTWLTDYPQEKVYLQFDKDYYSAGETIWFKAYLTSDFKRDRISSNLQVDLIDHEGNIVKSVLLPILNGGASGAFTMEQGFPPGDYRIRAFTSWMLNFDPDFLFEKDVHIYKPTADGLPEGGDSSATAAAPPVTQNPDTAFAVQFFPEGGDLVGSVHSIVAFKAINSQGLPIDVSGSVYSEQGDTLAAISCVHDGMGSFSLIPKAGVHYFARVTSAGGGSKTFELPAAKTSGVVLHVKNLHGKLFFQLSGSPDASASFGKPRIVVQESGHLVDYVTLDFDAGLMAGVVSLDGLPSGIVQVTAFSEKGTPLAERLFFVNHEDWLQMQLNADNLSAEKRQKNTFTLQLPDSSFGGHFSVAVTDADQVSPAPHADNIVSHLLLTSDIKGYVHDPGWYLESNDSLHAAALDLVMMTNGWRRFTWQKILNGQYPETHYIPENLLEIKGQLMEDKKPLSSGKISFILKCPADSINYYISSRTDNLGHFIADGLVFRDTASLFYKATDTAHPNQQRQVDVDFAPPATAVEAYKLVQRPLAPALISSEDQLKQFLMLSNERNQVQKMITDRNIMLQGVTVKGQKVPKKTTEDRYATPIFKQADGVVLDLTKENVNFVSIMDYLQGKVAGLMVMNGQPPRITYHGGTPAFFLDEVPVGISSIADVPITDVAMIKVIRPPFILSGASGGGEYGAVAVYTRRGGDRNSTVKGFDKILVPGYSLIKEFYSPDYSVKQETDELDDKRITLYWNPELVTDSATHAAHFSFYNNDITHHFRIVIEGVSNSGRPGRIEKVFPQP